MTESSNPVSNYADDVDVHTLVLGESDALIRFDRLSQQQALLTRMLHQAESSIVVFGERFDMSLIGRNPVMDALTGALLRQPQLKIRTLVHYSMDLVRSDSLLAERLRQAMPAVECRLRKPATGDFAASCIVVDDTGYLYFPDPDRRTGSACFHGVGTATKLLDVFEQDWQVAEPDPEMRVLVI